MDLYIKNVPDAVGLFHFVLVIELTSAKRRARCSFRREAKNNNTKTQQNTKRINKVKRKSKSKPKTFE